MVIVMFSCVITFIAFLKVAGCIRGLDVGSTLLPTFSILNRFTPILYSSNCSHSTLMFMTVYVSETFLNILNIHN